MGAEMLPHDDDPKTHWHATKPPPLAPATDPGHIRCVSCKELVPLVDVWRDLGVDAKGRWEGLGWCLACKPPAPDPMTAEDYAAHEVRGME